ncbi:MAG: ParB/RepB/Spo0J family partition protein [Firmicutes bacterium]|nr:ParB/RepB/Spo0J family partition protein [Bacillota bacterium]
MNNKEMEKTILQVPVEDIIPNRFQPRLSFDDTSLNDLALSIKQHGIIQPLVLRRKNDKYEIIAGERRFKAAKLAGLASVPAVISNLDDNASAEVAIVENIQRKDLTAIEEAKSFQALLDKGYMTQDELARKMGLSQSAISNKLRLLTLDESVQDAILSEKISERHARTLLKVPSHEKQKELLNKIINERLTVKQLEDEIKNMELTPNNEINVNPEPIAPKEEMLSDNNKNNNLGSIEDIYSNAMDIKDIIGNEQRPEELQPVEKVTPDAFFSNPEKMPNKFFNFLEDSAANMDTNEKIPTFEIPKHENTNPVNLINQTEDIEMLDDLFTKSPKASDNNQDYLNYVIKTIRGLNLDSNKVRLEEMNLPTEYHINIIIKKDDSN